MSYCRQGWFREQFGFLKRQFVQEGDLPFTNVLSEETVAPALEEIDVSWKDRIYTPLVTLWVFLGQVLSTDHSCRAAVARLIAHRISRGKSPCSAETGAYCQTRKRLPEKFFSTIARLVG
ncbi:MAG: IS4 family transposase, partial [Planctomycetaceae bacterium]|nr:IS4 family transposase [Planctomycetaceae bacterium]